MDEARGSKHVPADGGEGAVVRGSGGQGLVWGLLAQEPAHAFSVKVFFLACVVVAGVFGSLTVSRRILVVQAGPAALALALLWTSRG